MHEAWPPGGSAATCLVPGKRQEAVRGVPCERFLKGAARTGDRTKITLFVNLRVRACVFVCVNVYDTSPTHQRVPVVCIYIYQCIFAANTGFSCGVVLEMEVMITALAVMFVCDENCDDSLT